MKRQKVESSNVQSIGYDDGVLEVAFNKNSIYRYYGVTEDIYKELMISPSKGKFLNNRIKSIFKVRKKKNIKNLDDD